MAPFLSQLRSFRRRHDRERSKTPDRHQHAELTGKAASSSDPLTKSEAGTVDALSTRATSQANVCPITPEEKTLLIFLIVISDLN